MFRQLFAAVASALLVVSAPLHGQVVTVQTADEGVALVTEGIERVRSRQAALPPPVSTSEELARMAELDQAPRLAISRFDLSALSEAEKQSMWRRIGPMLQQIDRTNQERLLAMVPAEGWFPISTYGREAASAAFLIVQHADETLWRRFLPKIEAMAKAGEAEGGSYALMYDRLALSEGRPQRYGSQLSCQDGRYQVTEPVEDWSAVDTNRAAVGLGTIAENLKRFEGRGC